MSANSSKGNQNRNQHSLRNQGGYDMEERDSPYKLSPGIKWIVLTVLGWSIFSHLIAIMGVWEPGDRGGDWDIIIDTVIHTLSIATPAATIIFILALEM